MGSLIFWDKNGDGRFRWRQGDFVTNKAGVKTWRRDPRIKETLQKIDLKYPWQIKSLSKAALAYQKKTQRPDEKSDHKILAEEKVEALEVAIVSGDWQDFTERLRDLQDFLASYGASLTPKYIQELQDRTRMQYHLRQAAESLVEGRVDLALMDLKWARDYAEKLGVEWDEETIADALQYFLLGAISQEDLRDTLQRLEEADPQDGVE